VIACRTCVLDLVDFGGLDASPFLLTSWCYIVKIRLLILLCSIVQEESSKTSYNAAFWFSPQTVPHMCCTINGSVFNIPLGYFYLSQPIFTFLYYM
jgi:hypothetical protein